MKAFVSVFFIFEWRTLKLVFEIMRDAEIFRFIQRAYIPLESANRPAPNRLGPLKADFVPASEEGHAEPVPVSLH